MITMTAMTMTMLAIKMEMVIKMLSMPRLSTRRNVPSRNQLKILNIKHFLV
jgi:hypothetical protein